MCRIGQSFIVMLPLLLPAVWLVVASVFVAVCRLAANGDGAQGGEGDMHRGARRGVRPAPPFEW